MWTGSRKTDGRSLCSPLVVDRRCKGSRLPDPALCNSVSLPRRSALPLPQTLYFISHSLPVSAFCFIAN